MTGAGARAAAARRAAAGSALTGLGLAAVLGRRARAARRTAREVDALLAGAGPSPGPVGEDDLERLPDPVRRWLRHSGVVGTPVPATVRLRQVGTFRPGGRRWLPFRAEQYYRTSPPGFVWAAAFRVAPLVAIVGRDRYDHGTADLEMRLLSVLPVARASGGGLDRGALLRFLGELQWFPALATAGYLSWEAQDADTAHATIRDGGTTATMTFLVDAAGRVREERALRYNASRGRDERWVNRNDAEAEVRGVRIPVAGEARWEYDSGPYPYIRWRVTDVEPDRPARYRSADD